MIARGTTLAVIIGHRGFFSSELCQEGRAQILSVLREEGIRAISLDPEATHYGTVETWDDAKKCASLLRAHRDEIDGVLISLPNFGDERALVDSLRLSGLSVPILVQASPDHLDKFDLAHRRDSFCGKISVCNNLRQSGFPFTLTRLHTVAVTDERFREDLTAFAATCRVVRGLRSARFGAIGARPAAFNTVRFSEKLLQASGISVEPIDLSEILRKARLLGNQDQKVAEKLDAIRDYACTEGVSEEALQRMAKFGVVVDSWIEERELDGVAIQCWSSLEENYGMAPCTVMSMLSNALIPAACEVDVMGLLSMYALSLASLSPSAIVDWNNNYGREDDKAVIFHCGNFAKDLMEKIEIQYAQVLATQLGEDDCYGAVSGRFKAGDVTFARLTTDDKDGRIRGYIGQGRLTNDALNIFGAFGVIEVPEMQRLMRHICVNGFEHHVAMSLASSARVIYEAMTTYMGWDVYWHGHDGR